MEDYLNQKNRYVGKRCLLLVRCSTDQQAETSIPAQQDLLRAFAAANGMAVVGEIVLDGVSGSKPGAREDIDEIIERKRKQNDFEILLVQNEDRFTRSGPEHAGYLKYKLMLAGIQLVFALSDAPEGSYGSIVRSMKYQAAEETVKMTSLRSCQGYQRALENGNVATCTHAPYGTHRLYCSAEGKPLFILRDNRDGTQDKLHHETRAVLETYGTIGGGAKGHYRKQKSEKVCLVPGEDKEVAIVRRIFQLRYMEGWGGRRIANLLNSEGIQTPHGKRWTQRQVEVVSENETYVGLSVADRIGSGRFNQRAKGQPQRVELDPTVVATKKTLPTRLRDESEWVIQDQPHLKDYLAEPLRSIAEAKIREIWTERCRPGRRKKAYNPHSDSDYLLTNILTCKQDGRRLKGYTSGKPNKKARYYVHPLAQKDPVAAGFANTTFRADALESAVLQILTEMLKAMPMLRANVETVVDAAIAQQTPQDPKQIEQWEAQLAALSKKMTAILSTVADQDDVAEAKALISELSRQKQDLRKKMDAAMKAGTKVDHPSREAIVASVMERLANLASDIQNLPTYQLKQVLAALIESMTADMLTREVQIKLRMPSSAITDAKTAILQLSLQQSLGSSTLLQAHGPAASSEGFILAEIDCQFSVQSQKPCFTCRRKAA